MSHRHMRTSSSSPIPMAHSTRARKPDSQELRLYKRRYLVCIVFAVNSMFNQMLWITFAPIQSRAADHYHVSRTAINVFSLLFMICYVPGSLLSAYMFKTYGLRKSFCLLTALQVIGAALRYLGSSSWIASLLHTSTNDTHLAYIVVVCGQTMCAMVQPLFTNSPSRIALAWFSVDGRDIATALLSIVGVVGVGLGCIVPTVFVTADGTHYSGFEGLMLLELILCAFGWILTVALFYDKPPTSPSLSQRLKMMNAINTSFAQDFCALMTNCNFMCLLFGFGIGLGIFNAIVTLINQYTAMFGYNTENAGIFGAVLIGGGVVGAVIVVVVMQMVRKYNLILKVCTMLAAMAMAVLLYALQPDNLWMLTVCFGCVGLTAVPVMAVTFEAAAECTYPVDEELSAGVLMTAGQVFGIVYVVVWGYLLSTRESFDSQDNFSSWLVAGSMLALLLFVLFYRGGYNRLTAARQIHSMVNSIDDTTTITHMTTPVLLPSGNDKAFTNPLLTANLPH